ncbi:MAG: 50S ribosomal protein L30e [Candidatus ainarchaeum sp.]|nr:50S ribosomal protein L30e [Candidatus ainarchaeum sp.]
MDLAKEIRRTVDTGEVSFGYKSCKKSLLKGEGKLIIISNNVPKLEKETILHLANISKKGVVEFELNGLKLGSVCGKPFGISTMIVINEGKSNILEAIKK